MVLLMHVARTSSSASGNRFITANSILLKLIILLHMFSTLY